jgi:hypothetical protein
LIIIGDAIKLKISETILKWKLKFKWLIFQVNYQFFHNFLLLFLTNTIILTI